MIYDELKNIKTYKGINKNLDKAIDFIVEKKYLDADFGKNIVDDDKIYFDYPETVSTRENIDLELDMLHLKIALKLKNTILKRILPL